MNEETFQLPIGKMDLAATTPVPEQPKLSRKQIGQMRRRYMTTVHSTVVACEHKFNTNRIPSNNCFWCWQAYFKTSVNLDVLRQILILEGPTGLNTKYGEKYVKMFKRFMEDELSNREVSLVPPAMFGGEIENTNSVMKGTDGISEETERGEASQSRDSAANNDGSEIQSVTGTV
jgi:hypothetical protein